MEDRLVTDYGAMQGLIELLSRSLEDLGVDVSLNQLEAIAVTIHNAMSIQTRSYHNLEHVFNFNDPSDPIVNLAALFHDIVYYQVDKGFQPDIEVQIRAYINERNGKFFIDEDISADDRLVHLMLEVFGFSPGNQLSLIGGLNEFLSALVMIKMLGGLVGDKELLDAAVCIEATIPFRGIDAQGHTHFEVLEMRLKKLQARCHFVCTQEGIDTALKRAIRFSNKDVENFAELNVSHFLDITWKLLPESNIALRSRGIYTIREYRIAIQNMEKFLFHLNPDNIFNQYKDAPTDEEYKAMRRQAHHNVKTAVYYLHIKLLTMALLEALAEYSGGDAPLSLFVGDIPRGGEKVRKLDDFLPPIEIPARINPETDEVYQLLDVGRHSESTFDLRNSPTSLYIYKFLLPEQAEQVYQNSVTFFNGQMNAEEFLQKVPRPLLQVIVRGCMYMAYTRREKLSELLNNF